MSDDWLQKRFSIDDEDEEPRQILHLSGLEEAVIGVAYNNGATPVLAYDYDACVALLVEKGMQPQVAMLMMETSIHTPVGEGAPVIIRDMGWEEAMMFLEGEG